MTYETTITQQKAARIAGTTYVLIIASSICAMFVGPFKLIVPNDIVATVANISSNQLLFRSGALYDLIMYAGVVVLSAALYVTLKPINPGLALTAMLWRIGEAVFGCLGVLAHFTILLLVGNGDYISHFDMTQRQALIGLILDVKDAVIPMVFMFLSLGSIVYCFLFLKAQYIPRWIAVFGIVAFTIALSGTFANIIFSTVPVMAFGAPAILFELTIGLWLWLKGINIERDK